VALQDPLDAPVVAAVTKDALGDLALAEAFVSQDADAQTLVW
jgi:hypothetical protein